MKYNINIQNMSHEEEKLLGQFLLSKKNEEEMVWRAREEYSYTDNEKVEHSIILNSTIFQRGRSLKNKEVKHDNDDVRYGVITESVAGTGSFSSVKRLSGTLVPKADASIFYKEKPKGKKRVVKEIKIKKTNPKRIDEEYKYQEASGKSHVKPVTYDKDTAYLAMREAQGKSLSQIIKENQLSDYQRALLSQAILLAYKEQVLDQGIIHQDLKSENIYVDVSVIPYDVTILDFGCATTVENFQLPASKRDVQFGTPAYEAPEKVKGAIFPDDYPMDEKVDMFSLGRIIGEVWNNENFNKYSISITNHAGVSGDDLKLNIDFEMSTPHDIQEKVKSTIRAMTEFFSNDRVPVDKAIEKFTEIPLQLNIHLLKTESDLKVSVRRKIRNMLDLSSNKYQENEPKRFALENLLNKINHLDNINRSFSELYNEWESEDCIKYPYTGETLTNAEVIDKHRNILSRNFSSGQTNTRHQLESVIASHYCINQSPDLYRYLKTVDELLTNNNVSIDNAIKTEISKIVENQPDNLEIMSTEYANYIQLALAEKANELYRVHEENGTLSDLSETTITLLSNLGESETATEELEQLVEQDHKVKLLARQSLSKLLDPKSTEYQPNKDKQHAIKKLIAQLTDPKNRQLSYSKIYKEWREEPCLKRSSDNKTKTNQEVVSHHQNFFSRSFSSSMTNTAERLYHLFQYDRIDNDSPKYKWLSNIKDKAYKLPNSEIKDKLTAAFEGSGPTLQTITNNFADNMINKIFDIAFTREISQEQELDKTESLCNFIQKTNEDFEQIEDKSSGSDLRL